MSLILLDFTDVLRGVGEAETQADLTHGAETGNVIETGEIVSMILHLTEVYE